MLLVVGVQIATNNAFAEERLGEETSVVTPIHRLNHQRHSLDSVQLPYLPDAELGSIGSVSSYSASPRVQRTQFGGAAFTLKDIAQVLAEREAMLFKHWRKSYDLSTLTSITHPVSEYYVFTLRHILI